MRTPLGLALLAVFGISIASGAPAPAYGKAKPCELAAAPVAPEVQVAADPAQPGPAPFGDLSAAQDCIAVADLPAVLAPDLQASLIASRVLEKYRSYRDSLSTP